MIRRLALAVAFVLVASAPAAAAPRKVRSASFDWDDNVAFMSTRVYLAHRHGGPELALSTAQWADVQKLVGVPGPYEHYAIDHRTYRDMGENGTDNLFLRALETSVTNHADWRGPSWKAFVKQLATPSGAKGATVITAREHEAQSLYDGLKWLKKRGLIANVPPRANLWAVNRPGVAIAGQPLTGTTPTRKLRVQMHVLDSLQAAAFRGHGQRQEWHFSDDDWANYAATREGLETSIRQRRWPDVDIVLHFTGQHDPAHAAEERALRAY